MLDGFCRCVDSHDTPFIKTSPVLTKNCLGSTWPIQRSSSKPRSVCLEIDQKIIAKEKLAQTDGLQDLPRPQLLAWRNRLCKRLWSSEDPRFCYKMQGKWWTVQVLHQEGCRLLPWVQVADLNKTRKLWFTITCKGSAVHCPSAPTLHLPCITGWKVLVVETPQIKKQMKFPLENQTVFLMTRLFFSHCLHCSYIEVISFL